MWILCDVMLLVKTADFVDFAHVNMYIDCKSVNFCLNKENSSSLKEWKQCLRQIHSNLDVLHRHFHFNTPSNFQSRPIKT